MTKEKNGKKKIAALLLMNKFREGVDPLVRGMTQSECASPNFRLLVGNNKYEKLS